MILYLPKDYTVLQHSNYLLNLQEAWSLLIFVLSKLVQLYLIFYLIILYFLLSVDL